MVLPNKYAIVAGAVLAAIAAVIAFLHLGGYWTAGLQAAIIMGGVFGVQMLTPAAIAQKIPAHVAAVASTILTAVNVVLQANVGLPEWAHAVIGAAFAVAASLGIVVTGVAVSKRAQAKKAR